MIIEAEENKTVNSHYTNLFESSITHRIKKNPTPSPPSKKKEEKKEVLWGVDERFVFEVLVEPPLVRRNAE